MFAPSTLLLPRRAKVGKIAGEDSKLLARRQAAAKREHKLALMAAAKNRHPEVPDMTDGISDAIWIAHYGLGVVQPIKGVAG